MGRDKIKTTDLNLDHAAGIRKLCDGNLKYFYNEFLDGQIPPIDFYMALRFGEAITPHVEQVVDEAYFEALSNMGLTHEDLSGIPTFDRLLTLIYTTLEYIESGTKELRSEEAGEFRKGLKLYLTLMDKGVIRFIDKKKSKAIGR